MTNLRKMIHVHNNLNLDLVNIKLLKLAGEIQEFYATDYGTQDLP